jgi:chitinase
MVDADSGQVSTSLPALSVGDASGKEGDSNTRSIRVMVSLSAPSAAAVSVKVKSTGGTATAGQDYVAVDKTVKFKPGVVTRTLRISVMGDTTVETNETIALTLSSPAGAIIADATATATITNDD